MTLDQAVAFASNQSSASLSAPMFDASIYNKLPGLASWQQINAANYADILQNNELSKLPNFANSFTRTINILHMVRSYRWISEPIPGLDLSLISSPENLANDLLSFDSFKQGFTSYGSESIATAITNAAMLAVLSLGNPEHYYGPGKYVLSAMGPLISLLGYMQHTLNMQPGSIRTYLSNWLNLGDSVQPDEPSVDFSYTISNNTVTFTGIYSSPYPINSFVWRFGDGGVVTGQQNTSHTYQNQGTYTVKFEVIPEYGVPGSIEKSVTVEFFDKQTQYQICQEWKNSPDASRYGTGGYVDTVISQTISEVQGTLYSNRSEVIQTLNEIFRRRMRDRTRDSLVAELNQSGQSQYLNLVYQAFNSTYDVDDFIAEYERLYYDATAEEREEEQRIAQLKQDFANTWLPLVGQQQVNRALFNVSNRGYNYAQTEAALNEYAKEFNRILSANAIAGVDSEAESKYNQLAAQYNLTIERTSYTTPNGMTYPLNYEDRISTILIRAHESFNIPRDMANFPIWDNSQLNNYRNYLINRVTEVIVRLANPASDYSYRLSVILLPYYNTIVSQYNLMDDSSLPSPYDREENLRRKEARDYITNLAKDLAGENTSDQEMLDKFKSQVETYITGWNLNNERQNVLNEYRHQNRTGFGQPPVLISDLESILNQALSETTGVDDLRTRIDDLIDAWLNQTIEEQKAAMMSKFINAVKSVIGEDQATQMSETAMKQCGENWRKQFNAKVANIFWPVWDDIKSNTIDDISSVIAEFYKISEEEGYPGLKSLVDQAAKNVEIWYDSPPSREFWVFDDQIEPALKYFRSFMGSEGFKQELYSLYEQYKKDHPIIENVWQEELDAMIEEFKDQYQNIDGRKAIESIVDDYLRTANIATEEKFNNLGGLAGIRDALEDKLRGYIAGRRLEIRNKALVQYGNIIGKERCNQEIDKIFDRLPVFTPLSQVEDEVITKLNELAGIEEQWPTSAFYASDNEGTAPLTISFTNNSTGNINTYEWDFGDGATSSEQNPIHTFTEVNNYTVTLKVTGPGGEHSSSMIIIVKEPKVPELPEPPIPLEPGPVNYIVAMFDADIRLGNAPLEVNFTDWSFPLANIDSWYWDFGDGATSLEQNPTHTYQNPGNYDVSLKVSNPTYSDISYDNITVADNSVIDNAKAMFKAEPVKGDAPLEVIFTDESVGNITSWEWDFGDSATSSEQNPRHIYKTADVYVPKLKISGPDGTDTAEKKITVTQNGQIIIKKKKKKKSKSGWILAGLAGLMVASEKEEK